jgi:hypothetical protein
MIGNGLELPGQEQALEVPQGRCELRCHQSDNGRTELLKHDQRRVSVGVHMRVITCLSGLLS